MNSNRFTIKEAQRLKLNARIGLTGATNTGKTYTALVIAAGLLISEGLVTKDGKPDWSKVVVIDTERKRALFYANTERFGTFLHLDFEPPYDPNSYIEAVKYVESIGARVCIIDSLSHAWNGTGGILEIVQDRTEKSRTKNQYNEGWGGKEGGTALQNKMVDVIMATGMHTICTFRQKMEYTQERDETTGRTVITKQGVKPVQRDDLEYEFDITLKLNNDHSAEIIKNTVQFLGENKTIIKEINEDFGKALGDYLNKGLDKETYEKEQKDLLVSKVIKSIVSDKNLEYYFSDKHPNKKPKDLTLTELKQILNDFKELV